MFPFPCIAVDIGNARMKLGRFDCDTTAVLPEPQQTLQLASDAPGLDALLPCLQGLSSRPLRWLIGSVNRPAATRLLGWIRQQRPHDHLTLLAAGDLPLVVELERPDMVGVDRLLDAVAANRLRRPDCPAVVVDVGTAITVDLVDARGAFRGGAILPGIAMSARALHELTDLLPLIEYSELAAPPPPVGTATVPAMRAGLFWGAVGAIRELVERMTAEGPARPQVFLTGGAGPAVAELLGPAAQHVPHLTLAGIALTGLAMGLQKR